MSSRIFLLLVLFIAFIQGPLLPLVFAEGLLLIFYLWSNNFDKNYVWPFAAGIIFDLVQDQHIGITAILFLTVTWLLKNLRGNIPLQRPIILVLLVDLVFILRSYILNNNVSLWILIILSLISYLLFSLIWGGRREIRLG